MASGAIVVTGASSGIGEACVLRLAADGFHVFAGVRSDADLARWSPEDGVTPVRIDVANGDSIAAAARQVEGALDGSGLAGLVNNAGVSVPGPIEYLPIDELRRQLEVNLVGQVAVTQALLPALRRARGRVVFIGSVGGRVALPLLAAYNASKHGLEAVTDSLRQELRSDGMEVSIVEPGAVKTRIWEKGKASGDEMLATMPPEAVERYGGLTAALREEAERGGRDGMPPEKVADRVAHALTARRPRTRYLLGTEARAHVLLRRLLGDRRMDALVARR
ncbi:MAG: SDR family oxidoreductase, partial [Actinomycetota bacterium]|nr:SDR family oxidoreductase [Actinomycetota bacterium]